ncbi:MAG TPA: zinc-binding dehydrogenase [Verrucomicrobiae bacterium]
MRAVQLTTHGTPGTFVSSDIPKPKPAPDEVLVQVKACGLNRLDLWAEEGGLPIPLRLPRTLGGEVAGVIAELGDDVDDWRTGERVAIQSNLFCGSCEYCLKGDESICLNGKLLGVDRDGGFAEFVAVPARSLVRIPAGVEFTASAALTLAGSTAMHMLTNRTEIRSSDWVLVIAGASGVGTYAIQITKQFGARVIATGSTEAKRTFAKTMGADEVIDSTDADWPSRVRDITQKRGVDLVVEHVGGDVFEGCFKCLARGGTIVTCGATAGRDVRMNLWPFFVKQQQIIGSYGRNRADVEVTMEWAAYGKIKPVIHQTFPLERVPEAFAALRSRAVNGKIVITP